jgi:hypothetical protein
VAAAAAETMDLSLTSAITAVVAMTIVVAYGLSFFFSSVAVAAAETDASNDQRKKTVENHRFLFASIYIGRLFHILFIKKQFFFIKVFIYFTGILWRPLLHTFFINFKNTVSVYN